MPLLRCVVWSVLGLLIGSVSLEAAEPNLQGLSKTSSEEAATWQPRHMLPKFDSKVTAVAFDPTGTQLAVGLKGEVRFFDASQAEAVATPLPCKGQVTALAYSPDGAWLALGGYQTLRLHSRTNPQEVVELSGHRGVVTSLAFSPDGKHLVSTADDESARLWNLSDHTSSVLPGHTYPVNGVAFSADGQHLLTAAGDVLRPTKGGEVVLRSASGAVEQTWADHTRAALCGALSANGKLAVTGGLDERALVYDLAENKLLGFYGGHQRPVNAVQFLPGSETVISVSGGRSKGGNTLQAWNARDGHDLAIGDVHQASILTLAVTRDGKRIATGGQDQTVYLWETAFLTATDSAATAATAEPAKPAVIRIGVIGLDTSHAPAFAKLLNDPNAAEDVSGCKIVAAYPKGSPDIESSTSRVPGYVKQYEELGIAIVDSIPALLEQVDCVLLETNDGRPHLEQVLPVLKAGKPCFIDKPIAGSLADAIAIFEAAEKYKTPVFSSSSLRYMAGAQEVRNGKIGKVLGCDAFSPCSLEATHPDLFWYGIHGVEILFTVMGTGCESVSRTHSADFDLAVGAWSDGRIGTFRGIRKGAGGYGGRAFGDKASTELGGFGGYRPLVVEIVKFFKTRELPISPEETLEIYAFMEAADESKRNGGAPVKLADVMAKARAAVKVPE